MKSPYRITFLSALPAILLGGAGIFLPFNVNAGMPEKNPIVENLERPFDWSGFYIGGNIGGALSDFEFHGSGDGSDGHLFSDVSVGQQFNDAFADFDIIRFFDATREHDRPNHEERRGSIIGGGQIGYQKQFGHFVFGVEGDFDRMSARSSAAFRDAASSTVFSEDNVDAPNGGGQLFAVTADTDFSGMRRAQANWMGSARGKFGYATGAFLFYGTAGVAFTEVEAWAHDIASSDFFFNNTDDVTPRQFAGRKFAPNGFPQNFFVGNITNTRIDRDDDVIVGWTAGGGIEVAFNDAVSLALEYRHNGFGSETFHFTNHGGPIFPGGTKVDFDNDQVTVKMNVLLNHFFGHDNYASAANPVNTIAAKSPFGKEEGVAVAYNRAQGSDKWAAKDKEIPVQEVFDWSGFYVGANVGGVWTDYDFSDYDARVDVGQQFFDNGPVGVFVPFRTDGTDDSSDDSLFGGGQVGYQRQFGHFVVGVEGDFGGMSSSGQTSFASTNFGDIDEEFFTVTRLDTMRKATVDWTASARIRLGYARGPVLLYVTGGGAWSQVRTWAIDRASTDFFVDRLPPFLSNRVDTNHSNDEDVVSGWTAGGGAEWAFSKIASVGLEYRHNGFGDTTSHYDPHRGPIYPGSSRLDIDSDQVTLRVNLLLGHMGPGH